MQLQFWRFSESILRLKCSIPSRPKLLQKNSLQRKCFEAINFVKITKQSLYKTNSLACFLAKRDTPVAATLQRKSFRGIIFVIITKKITKIIVSGNYFVIISARMVLIFRIPDKIRGLMGGSLEDFNLAWSSQSRRAILRILSVFGPLGILENPFATPQTLKLGGALDRRTQSRRLWRSRRRKSSSVPEGAASFPAAVFLARKAVRNFPAASKFARKLFQQGISDSHWATAFSSFLNKCSWKGFRAIQKGLVPVTGPSVPLTGPSVPPTGPRLPLRDLFIEGEGAPEQGP